jgi:hypothetical protein
MAVVLSATLAQSGESYSQHKHVRWNTSSYLQKEGRVAPKGPSKGEAARKGPLP